MSTTVIDLLRAGAAEQRLTQAQLAERAGVGQPWISETMTGRREPSPLLLCRLAQLTGVGSGQLINAGRADIAQMLDATPSAPLIHASDQALAAELYRRSREPRALLVGIRATIEERIDLPSNTYRWLGWLADASTLADLLRAVTGMQQRTPDLLTEYLGSTNNAHPAVLAAAELAACDLRSDRELATLPDGSDDAADRAHLVGTAGPTGITYPAVLERWVREGELYLAYDPRDIPDLPPR